ncbi:MAG: hypothetical protein OXE99_14175 [Cellvibrionales bacterium]|nr:hypothetical protein [Cellvibrionales bacterium]
MPFDVKKKEAFAPLFNAKDASDSQQYYGVFVAQSTDFSQSFSIEKSDGLSKITSLEGDLYQFIFDEIDERQVFEQDTSSPIYPFEYNALLWQSLPISLNKSLSQALAYNLLNLGEKRIAGRLVTEYLLEPIYSDRYAVALYIEPDSGVLLKKSWYWQSHLIASATMSALSPTPVTPLNDQLDSLTLKESTKNTQDAPVKANSLTKSLSLPKGFELTAFYVSGKQSHAYYSDGICELSAFFTELPDNEPYRLQENQQGSFSGVAQSVTLAKKHYQLTLCGHLPLATLQKMMLALS